MQKAGETETGTAAGGFSLPGWRLPGGGSGYLPRVYVAIYASRKRGKQETEAMAGASQNLITRSKVRVLIVLHSTVPITRRLHSCEVGPLRRSRSGLGSLAHKAS